LTFQLQANIEMETVDCSNVKLLRIFAYNNITVSKLWFWQCFSRHVWNWLHPSFGYI